MSIDTTATAAGAPPPVGAVEAPSLVEASNIIRGHVIVAMGVGLVPVPGFDFAALVAVMVKMVHSLGRLYGASFVGNLPRNLIVALLAGILPVAAGAGVASLLKFVPGLGTVAGVASMSLLSGALTYAVGKVFVQHFESGGTFLDFEPSKVRERFRAAFEEGKAYARGLGGTATVAPPPAAAPSATPSAASMTGKLA